MAKDQTIVVRGRLDWAKIVGKARPYSGNPKYDKGPYWSVDITPDKKSLAVIKAAGIEDKLKSAKGNDKRTEKFLSLTILETKADGTKNNPPAIKNASGENWPDGVLIGNGSIADIMIKVKDYGQTTGAYYQKARILEHVPFGDNDFAPLSEDDEFFAAPISSGKAEPANPDNFDDEEVPF